MGGPSACRAYGVTDRTLKNWLQRAQTDAAFRELVETKRREFEESWALDLRRRSEPFDDDSPSAELLRAVVASLPAVAARASLPPVLARVRPRQLAPARHPDLMLSHGAHYTACFVLPWLGEEQEAREQRLLGRLLFVLEDAALVTLEEDERLVYLERSRLLCRVAPVAVRPVVFTDYAPGPIFCRALQRVGGASFNVADVVRARPASQNVLASESADSE